MKVAGGLNFVTGPMGAGKSLYAVRRIVDYVSTYRYAVTNVELLPDWAERVAFHYKPWRSRARRTQEAEKIARFYVYETDLSEAMRYRIPAAKGEARAAFVWDEGHNELNNRRWKDDGRAEILEWGTQLRKLGFVGFLLTQHADNTDAALRRVANFHVRLQNQREAVRMFGLRVLPVPLFLAYWYPAHLGQHGAKVEAARVDRYPLSWHRRLYDTHGLYHGLTGAGADANTIVLPRDGLALSQFREHPPLHPIRGVGAQRRPEGGQLDSEAVTSDAPASFARDRYDPLSSGEGGSPLLTAETVGRAGRRLRERNASRSARSSVRSKSQRPSDGRSVGNGDVTPAPTTTQGGRGSDGSQRAF